MGARLSSLLCAWGALKGVPDGDQMSSIHPSWLNTGTGCSYFFCSRDETLATSFHSQQFVSGLKKPQQISAFTPPKPSSICVSRCSWCCSNPQLFTSLVSDARWDLGDARTTEAGPDTTTVATMPLCLQVAADRCGRWLSPSITCVGTWRGDKGWDWQTGEDQGAHTAPLVCQTPHFGCSLTQPWWEAPHLTGGMHSPEDCQLLVLPTAPRVPRKEGRMAVEPRHTQLSVGRRTTHGCREVIFGSLL